MSSPEIGVQRNKSAAGPAGKKGSPQKLRVLSEFSAPRTTSANITMPQAKTELSELLSGDELLCVRPRRPVAAERQAVAGSAPSVLCANPELQAAHRESTAEEPNRAAQAPDPPADTTNDDLAGLISLWPRLPHDVRAAVLAMVHESPTGCA
jgi:hypothetical protein